LEISVWPAEKTKYGLFGDSENRGRRTAAIYSAQRFLSQIALDVNVEDAKTGTAFFADMRIAIPETGINSIRSLPVDTGHVHTFFRAYAWLFSLLS
jgi:hypothetical protein